MVLQWSVIELLISHVLTYLFEIYIFFYNLFKTIIKKLILKDRVFDSPIFAFFIQKIRVSWVNQDKKVFMRYCVFCLINIKYIFAIQKKVVIFVNASDFILSQCNLNIIMGSLIVSSPTSVEIWEDQANYIWTNLKQISTHNLETAQTH